MKPTMRQNSIGAAEFKAFDMLLDQEVATLSKWDLRAKVDESGPNLAKYEALIIGLFHGIGSGFAASRIYTSLGFWWESLLDRHVEVFGCELADDLHFFVSGNEPYDTWPGPRDQEVFETATLVGHLWAAGAASIVQDCWIEATDEGFTSTPMWRIGELLGPALDQAILECDFPVEEVPAP